MPIRILMSTGGVAGTNCYLIADEPTGQAVLFDAPDHTTAELLRQAVDLKYDVIGLWLTHGHFDHIADHAVVTGAFPNAKVGLHPADVSKLANAPAQTRAFGLGLDIPGRQPDFLVADGQVLHIGNTEVRALHTPGHAPGHIVYYFPAEKVAVGGDLIICGAVGRTDLPDSDPIHLVESIRKLYRTVPEETEWLPGHCEPSTLARERQTNPYVRAILGDAPAGDEPDDEP